MCRLMLGWGASLCLMLPVSGGLWYSVTTVIKIRTSVIQSTHVKCDGSAGNMPKKCGDSEPPWIKFLKH